MRALWLVDDRQRSSGHQIAQSPSDVRSLPTSMSALSRRVMVPLLIVSFVDTISPYFCLYFARFLRSLPRKRSVELTFF